MKKFGLIVIATLLLFLTEASAQKNLVTNPGFEDEELYGWNNNGAKQTPWAFKSGKNSCAIITQDADKWVGIDQIIKIPKKTKAITVSAWLKTTNVVKGKNDWDGAVFLVVFLDGQEKEVGPGTNIARITGDSDWNLAELKIPVPEKASSFKVMCAMGNASGTMLIDDVTAKAVTE